MAEAVAAVEAGGGVARGWTLDVTDLGAVAGVAAENLLTLRLGEWPGS